MMGLGISLDLIGLTRCCSSQGALMLKEAPELMAMGEYTLRIPHPRPSSLPQGCTVRQVMAFGTPNRKKVFWFVAKSEDEIK